MVVLVFVVVLVYTYMVWYVCVDVGAMFQHSPFVFIIISISSTAIAISMIIDIVIVIIVFLRWCGYITSSRDVDVSPSSSSLGETSLQSGGCTHPRSSTHWTVLGMLEPMLNAIFVDPFFARATSFQRLGHFQRHGLEADRTITLFIHHILSFFRILIGNNNCCLWPVIFRSLADTLRQ